MKICSVPKCERPSRRYGYCEMHSQRLMKRGDPLDSGKHMIRRRIQKNMSVTASGCWQWTSQKTTDGYARIDMFVNGKKVSKLAHRISYREFKGEIPSGLVLDHLCRNRSCVNPDHLEPVTFAVNSQRALCKTHCKRGHPLSGQNLYVHKTGSRCLKCLKLRRKAA